MFAFLDCKIFVGRDYILSTPTSYSPPHPPPPCVAWDRCLIHICWINKWMSSGRLLGLGGQTQNSGCESFLHRNKSSTAITSKTYDLLEEHFIVRILTLPSNLHWNETKTRPFAPDNHVLDGTSVAFLGTVRFVWCKKPGMCLWPVLFDEDDECVYMM